MTDHDVSVTEEELHAYVDGQLLPERQAAVEAWLAAHADDRARVAAWQAQAQAIHGRYDGVADEPVGARFDLKALAQPPRRWRGIAVAATVAAFLIGGTAGWMARGAAAAAPSAFDRFTAEAIEAHALYVVEVRHPVEVAGDEAPHLTQWLSRRLGHPVRIPDLGGLGLKLVGGRLLPGPTGATAFFMYEGGTGERFTLYCARSTAPATAMRFHAGRRFAALFWADGDAAYVLSGEGTRERLDTVAGAAYAQLEHDPR